jgi:hypothetical protein
MKYLYCGFKEQKYQNTEPKEWIKFHHFNLRVTMLMLVSEKFALYYLYEVYGWYFETNLKTLFFSICWARIFHDFKKLFIRKKKPNNDDLPF